MTDLAAPAASPLDAQLGRPPVRGAKPNSDNGSADQTPITAAKVRELWSAGVRATRPQVRTYWLNRSFLKGEQWIWWDRVRDRVNEAPRDERVRVTANRLWPSFRRMMAKLCRRDLAFDVPANAADDVSIQAARLAEAVIAAVHQDHNWEQLKYDELYCRWLGGTAVLLVDWDPTRGVQLDADPMSGNRIATGDIVESVLSIAEWVTEPGTRDAEHARYGIKVIALPPEEVRDRYRLDWLPAADASMASSPSQGTFTTSDRRETPAPLSLVLTYYGRPTSRSKGEIAVIVNDRVVKRSAWPYPFKDRLPIVVTRETKTLDHWHGDTIYTSATMIQTALNQAWSSIVEHMKQAGNARQWMPVGTLDNPDELSDTPGELVPYNPVGDRPPSQWISPPNMPSWWLQQPAQLAGVMDDILGDHNVSAPEPAGQPDSGLGVAIVNEEDDTPLGLLAKEMADGWGRFATLCLRILEHNVTETRQARTGGAGQRPRVMEWVGKDLCGQTTAVVPLDAVVPRSRAAMQSWALRLRQEGLITTPQEFARVADLPVRDDFSESQNPDLAKAQRENLDLFEGEVRIPAPFDDHPTHIDEHLREMKSERFDCSPTEIQKLFIDHVQAHSTMAAEAAGGQAVRQAVHPALGAAPNPTGQPPVPMPPGTTPAPAPPAQPGVLDMGQPPPDGQQMQGPPGVPGMPPGQDAGALPSGMPPQPQMPL